MFSFDWGFCPDAVHLLPSVAVVAGRCEDPDCVRTHGIQVAVYFLFWGMHFTWEEEGSH